MRPRVAVLNSIGQPAGISPDQPAVRAIKEKLDAWILELQGALSQVADTWETLNPGSPAFDEKGAKDIPKIGLAMNPDEIRTQLLLTAGALSGLVRAVEIGAADPYVTPDGRKSLLLIRGTTESMVAGTPASIQKPIPAGLTGLSNEFTADFTQPLDEKLGELEREIVAFEAGDVGVLEPSERAKPYLAIGAVVLLVGAALYFTRTG